MNDRHQFDLRERTRRAVRREITRAAEKLFESQGYQATTIADIAAAVGMSQRSVFRYFATKEELVLGKLDFIAEEILEALAQRPQSEPLWDSLRHMLQVMVGYAEGSGKYAVAEAVVEIIFAAPPLLGSYLLKLQKMQDIVVAEMMARAEAANAPYASSDPTPRALTAAAFGCMVAAQQSWLNSDRTSSLGQTIGRALDCIGPTGAG